APGGPTLPRLRIGRCSRRCLAAVRPNPLEIPAVFALVAPSALLPFCVLAPQDSAGSVDARLKTLEQEVKQLEELRPESLQSEGPDEANLRVYWKDGLKLESRSKDIQLRLGGRFQFDAMAGQNDAEIEAANKEVEDGAEIRRARIYLEGSVTDRFEFR